MLLTVPFFWTNSLQNSLAQNDFDMFLSDWTYHVCAISGFLCVANAKDMLMQ